jgi:hypothetical protein
MQQNVGSWGKSGSGKRTLDMTRLTRFGSRAADFAVMHDPAFNDVVGCSPGLASGTSSLQRADCICIRVQTVDIFAVKT